MHLLPLTDERYPPLLRTIHDPPVLLYVRGELPPAEALAVVGSRRASEAGGRFTLGVCAELASRGITIVSGLARGIDTAAHLGALEGGGPTIGVLGCGIDRIYPPENARLFHRLLERGAILSEYPPGTPPLPGHFPGRNRIISGLSRGVLVVEAAAGSGSLITVEFALEQGREVFAVPGPVNSPVSSGVHQLLKEGAHLVTGAADILTVLWPQAPRRQDRKEEEDFAASLDGNARRLYQHLGNEPVHIDHLVRKSGLTPMEVSVILLHLELQGGLRTPSRHALCSPQAELNVSTGDLLRDRVLAIVTLIAQLVMEEREPLSEEDLVGTLLAVGFVAEEIDAAFSWMERLALQSAEQSAANLSLPTNRVFSAEETRALSSDARGFLLRLRAMGVLDDEAHEEVVERALAVG